MKWFKHLSGSLNDSLIFKAIEKFGSDGYIVFFGVLELMADEFDIYNPGKNIISLKKITKNLQLSRQKTVKILSFFDQKAKINKNKCIGFYADVIGDDVHLNCPRLKELTDEYTQKHLNKMSGHTPDVNRDKLRNPLKEVEEEVDNNKEKLLKRKCVYFDDFWKLYPKKLSKEQARKNWNKLKLTDELFKKIMVALKTQIENGLLKRDDKYTPHPGTWISRGKWGDDIIITKSGDDRMLTHGDEHWDGIKPDIGG